MQIGKEEIKVFLDDMILYINNPKEFTKTIKNKFSQLQNIPAMNTLKTKLRKQFYL